MSGDDTPGGGGATTGGAPDGVAAAGAGGSDWRAGDRLPTHTFRVTRAELVRYAGAAGDFNPIHWSDRVAGQVGLPGVIAHGMLTMALAGRAVTGWAGAPDAVLDFAVRFGRPVPVPDDDTGVDIEVGAVVKSVTDGRAELELTVTCHGQKVLGQARATVRAGDR